MSSPKFVLATDKCESSHLSIRDIVKGESCCCLFHILHYQIRHAITNIKSVNFISYVCYVDIHVTRRYQCSPCLKCRSGQSSRSVVTTVTVSSFPALNLSIFLNRNSIPTTLLTPHPQQDHSAFHIRFHLPSHWQEAAAGFVLRALGGMTHRQRSPTWKSEPACCVGDARVSLTGPRASGVPRL